jgi:hypothetical protein
MALGAGRSIACASPSASVLAIALSTDRARDRGARAIQWLSRFDVFVQRVQTVEIPKNSLYIDGRLGSAVSEDHEHFWPDQGL